MMPRPAQNLRLTYQPRQFARLFNTPLGHAVWDLLCSAEILIRMETAAQLGRSPLEVLSQPLIWHFGTDAMDMQVKQMVGHMVKQIMAATGYCPAPTERRIPGANLFATGARYVPRADHERPAILSAKQRSRWLGTTDVSPFSRWLDRETRGVDGAINLPRLYDLARRFGLTERFTQLAPAQQRISIGVLLNRKVPPELYG